MVCGRIPFLILLNNHIKLILLPLVRIPSQRLIFGLMHLGKNVVDLLKKRFVHLLFDIFQAFHLVSGPVFVGLFVQARFKLDGNPVIHFENGDFEGRMFYIAYYSHGQLFVDGCLFEAAKVRIS